MAYEDPNKKDENKGPIQYSNAPVSAPTPGTPGGARVGTSGGRPFVSLAAYLDANKGNIGDTAERIASGIESEANTLRGDIDKGGRDAISSIRLEETGETAVPSYGPLAGQNYRQMRYSGPEGLDQDAYRGTLNTLQNRADMTQGPGGVEQLLKPMYGGRMTRGGLMLDSALLRGSSDAQARFGKAREAVSPLGSYLDATANNVAAQVGGAKKALGIHNATFDQAKAKADAERAAETAAGLKPSSPGDMTTPAATAPPSSSTPWGTLRQIQERAAGTAPASTPWGSLQSMQDQAAKLKRNWGR